MGASALSRRAFLFGAGALASGLPRMGSRGGSDSPGRRGTRLVLLGTGGWPSTRSGRAGPCHLVLVDDAPYLVDCGKGVARQLLRSGVHPRNLAGIFLTRTGADHAGDFADLLLMAWAGGRETPYRVHGPPPLGALESSWLAADESDRAQRLFRAREIGESGGVFEDERVRVTAARLATPGGVSLAFRFDTRDRAIVIAGNAAGSPEVARFLRGADVLVHEALYPPSVERLLGRAPYVSGRGPGSLALHADVEDAGRVAAAGGVTTLVLSRLVPGDDPSITDDMWRERAGRFFRGEIVVGKDLIEV